MPENDNIEAENGLTIEGSAGLGDDLSATAKDSRSNPAEETSPLFERIRVAAAGLYYLSETDADILPFAGTKAGTVTPEEIFRQTDVPADSPVLERDFDEFFEHQIEVKDWFEEEETLNAEGFAGLKKLLIENLSDIHVYKFGRLEIDIYVVGLNKDGVLMGIKTKAVET